MSSSRESRSLTVSPASNPERPRGTASPTAIRKLGERWVREAGQLDAPHRARAALHRHEGAAAHVLQEAQRAVLRAHDEVVVAVAVQVSRCRRRVAARHRQAHVGVRERAAAAHVHACRGREGVQRAAALADDEILHAIPIQVAVCRGTECPHARAIDRALRAGEHPVVGRASPTVSCSYTAGVLQHDERAGGATHDDVEEPVPIEIDRRRDQAVAEALAARPARLEHTVDVLVEGEAVARRADHQVEISISVQVGEGGRG
eukprot:scaffold65756_cov63-Phaeocystis_antarctica.AAC.1